MNPIWKWENEERECERSILTGGVIFGLNIWGSSGEKWSALFALLAQRAKPDVLNIFFLLWPLIFFIICFASLSSFLVIRQKSHKILSLWYWGCSQNDNKAREFRQVNVQRSISKESQIKKFEISSLQWIFKIKSSVIELMNFKVEC